MSLMTSSYQQFWHLPVHSVWSWPMVWRTNRRPHQNMTANTSSKQYKRHLIVFARLPAELPGTFIRHNRSPDRWSSDMSAKRRTTGNKDTRRSTTRRRRTRERCLNETTATTTAAYLFLSLSFFYCSIITRMLLSRFTFSLIFFLFIYLFIFSLSTNRYIHVPAKDHYEFGHKRGNDHHFIERHEKAHPHFGEFRTKVNNNKKSSTSRWAPKNYFGVPCTI